TTITSVEKIVLANGFNYSLAMNGGNAGTGGILTVDGSALDKHHGLIFDGSGSQLYSYKLIGGAGNDNLQGGPGNDTFDLTKGGHDIVNGGSSAGSYFYLQGRPAGSTAIITGTLNAPDDFFFGATLTAADRVNGYDIGLSNY